MARRKTTGLAVYSVDLLRDAPDDLMLAAAGLFDLFATVAFPKELNRMLLMPLYKGKGGK